MKKKCMILAAAISVSCLLSSVSMASAQTENALDLVMDIATTQYFTDEAVNEADLEKILLAGSNAPSAMNGQPWHFSVITDDSVLQQISEGMSFGGNMPGGFNPAEGGMPEGFNPAEGGMPEGFNPAEGGMPGSPSAGSGSLSKAGLTDAPVAIVVSCTNGSELDAGLACQNMSVAAQLLGYGTKIISSPTIALNGEKQAEYRTLLGIPENQSAAAILLIGMEDTSIDESVDGYTGATERNPLDSVVTYVTGQ